MATNAGDEKRKEVGLRAPWLIDIGKRGGERVRGASDGDAWIGSSEMRKEDNMGQITARPNPYKGR